MIIAFLFDWSAYDPALNYWHEIRDAVFSTGIIQKSGRHMKLAVGDVLVGLRAGQDAEELYAAAFENSDYRLIDDNRLIEGFPTIFGLIIDSMPRDLAAELNVALLSTHGYLGAVSVHLDFEPHLVLYRARIPPQFRLQGTSLRGSYSMGNEDECDEHELRDMERLGYNDVGFEDTGARRTIFDDFDKPRHFQRVAAFQELLTRELPGGEDDAYELTMLLEDLNPKLFNALGSASERLAEAETDEDVAQVALSGRRYMEQLADTLFPARERQRGERDFSKAAYRNRLWAFVQDQTSGDPARLREIGGKIDRIVEELNGGLHGSRTKDSVATSLSEAAALTATLFSLSPEAPRNGYLAYREGLLAFVRELASQHKSGENS